MDSLFEPLEAAGILVDLNGSLERVDTRTDAIKQGLGLSEPALCRDGPGK